MDGSRRLAVAFRGPRAIEAPLTFGQTAIWEVLRWLPPGDASLNQSAVVGAGGADAEAVTGALGLLLSRHEALRSLYRDGDGGSDGDSDGNGDGNGDGDGDGDGGSGPVQRVLDAGTLAVAVHDAPDGPAAAALAEDLRERIRALPFDIAEELPFRAALVTVDGRPEHIVLVLSHMAVDAWSLQIVLDDLGQLLKDPAGAEPLAQQPVERAAHERSAVGQRRARRALAFWEEGMRTLPADWLEDLRQGGPGDPGWCQLASPALAVAAHALADRERTTPGAVLRAGAALLLGLYRGRREVGVRMLVATRFLRETRLLVGAFNQNALLRVELCDEPFPAYLARVLQATQRAYLACECDPVELERTVAAVGRARGISSDGYCFFNDSTFAGQGPRPAVTDSAAATALLDRTRLTELTPEGDQKGSSFFLYFNEISDVAVLTLCADRRFLLPRTPRDFLADLEWLVLEAERTAAGPLALEAAWQRRQGQPGPGR